MRVEVSRVVVDRRRCSSASEIARLRIAAGSRASTAQPIGKVANGVAPARRSRRATRAALFASRTSASIELRVLARAASAGSRARIADARERQVVVHRIVPGRERVRRDVRLRSPRAASASSGRDEPAARRRDRREPRRAGAAQRSASARSPPDRARCGRAAPRRGPARRRARRARRSARRARPPRPRRAARRRPRRTTAAAPCPRAHAATSSAIRALPALQPMVDRQHHDVAAPRPPRSPRPRARSSRRRPSTPPRTSPGPSRSTTGDLTADRATGSAGLVLVMRADHTSDERPRRTTERTTRAACAPSSRGRAATAGSTPCCPRTMPRGAIAALSPNEVFELVHEVGFEDAQALIELATPVADPGLLRSRCVDQGLARGRAAQAVAHCAARGGLREGRRGVEQPRRRAARADPAEAGQGLRHHARRGSRRGQRRADHDRRRIGSSCSSCSATTTSQRLVQQHRRGSLSRRSRPRAPHDHGGALRAAGRARGAELSLALGPARRPRLRRLLRGARSVPARSMPTRSHIGEGSQDKLVAERAVAAAGRRRRGGARPQLPRARDGDDRRSGRGASASRPR